AAINAIDRDDAVQARIPTRVDVFQRLAGDAANRVGVHLDRFRQRVAVAHEHVDQRRIRRIDAAAIERKNRLDDLDAVFEQILVILILGVDTERAGKAADTRAAVAVPMLQQKGADERATGVDAEDFFDGARGFEQTAYARRTQRAAVGHVV